MLARKGTRENGKERERKRVVSRVSHGGEGRGGMGKRDKDKF